jgi:hypothetical protein
MMALAAFLVVAQISTTPAITIGASDWQVVREQSGPQNYYTVVTEGGATFIRSQFVAGYKTTVVGWKTPPAERQRVKKVRWSWRALKLPSGGDECVAGKGDSAAVVYLTWKRMLRYYSLKYVWSTAGTKGKICSSKRNLFVAQDTIILEAGGPVGVWKNEDVDLVTEFRRHFEGGDPHAAIPDFVGIGLMSDGDQTHSESSADFGEFTLLR